MRYIRVQPKKLLRFSLYYLVLIALSALGLYFYFTGLSLDPLSLEQALHYSVLFLTYLLSWIVIPLLTIRVLYYFVMMVRYGRRQGVGPFSAKFLFNPINLLIFASLLTDQGRTYRRRCLVAVILFACMISVMWLCASLGAQLAAQAN